MSKSKTPLNPTAASLLGFLHEDAMTGWDLLTLADSRIGRFWNLTKSQVYRELQSLADNGLVTTSDMRGVRGKRVFALTSKGKQAFAEWLQNEPTDEIIRHPLLLSAAFASHMSPETLVRFIKKHRTTHRNLLDEYQHNLHVAQNDPAQTGLLLTLSFGVQYEEMVLRWMDETLARLEDKK